MGKALHNVPPLPETLNRAHLAFELACDLMDQADILARFELSKTQLAHLVRHDPQFRHQYREYKTEWSSPKNSRERVKMKSAIAVEDGLPELYRLFRDPNIATQQRLEAFKQLTALADVTPKKDGPDTSSRFQVTINLGNDDAPQTITFGDDTNDDRAERLGQGRAGEEPEQIQIRVEAPPNWDAPPLEASEDPF